MLELLRSEWQRQRRPYKGALFLRACLSKTSNGVRNQECLRVLGTVHGGINLAAMTAHAEDVAAEMDNETLESGARGGGRPCEVFSA